MQRLHKRRGLPHSYVVERIQVDYGPVRRFQVASEIGRRKLSHWDVYLAASLTRGASQPDKLGHMTHLLPMGDENTVGAVVLKLVHHSSAGHSVDALLSLGYNLSAPVTER